jgi:serine/threonine protein kinase
VLQRFCREGVAWKHLRHPNILPLLGVTVSGHRFAMVSEWMEHGNINKFVERDPDANRAELVCHSSIPTPQSLTDVLFS